MLLRDTAELQEPDDREAALQEWLNSMGFELDVDGFAGPKTISALNEVLTELGLPAVEAGDELPQALLEIMNL